MRGPTLVTGATGKTGRRLIAGLAAAGAPVRAASRGGEPPFDWARPKTWAAALEGVASIYVVAPSTMDDPYSRIVAFLETALSTGPRRVVFLGMASLPAGAFAHGQVHQWLRDHSDDWAVLSPSAFMENFSEGPYGATIRDEDTIYSNTGSGRVPFIAASDIARAALAALAAPAPLNRDVTLTGGTAMSYDEVAAAIGEACGRPISHTPISTAALAERFMARGLPELTARFLAAGYETIAAGAQARTTDEVCALTGEAPTTFEAFATANAGAWARPASTLTAR